MAAIQGHDAARYAQVVDGPSDTGEFELGGRGTNDLHRSDVKGKSLFTDLTNADTITYMAVGLDDPSKWEVGIATYDSTNKQLDRTNANVVASSNSNNRVDFKASDGAGSRVLVQGISGVELTNAYTVSNFAADRTISATEATAANIAATLATLVNDLIEAGVITGSVS